MVNKRRFKFANHIAETLGVTLSYLVVVVDELLEHYQVTKAGIREPENEETIKLNNNNYKD